MTEETAGSELTVEVGADHVATLEINRPPSNYFSPGLIAMIASTCEQLAAGGDTRAIVLCSAGKVFCAGADFSSGPQLDGPGGLHLYEYAQRLFEQPLPIVAAVQGAAVGGGLGLAMAADFRVASRAGAVRRELRADRHPPGLRAHRHAAGRHRPAGRAGTALHRAPGDRRGGAHPRPGRRARRAGPGARAGARARRPHRRVRPAGRPLDPADDARPARRPGPRGHGAGTGRAGTADADHRLARGAGRGARPPPGQLQPGSETDAHARAGPAATSAIRSRRRARPCCSATATARRPPCSTRTCAALRGHQVITWDLRGHGASQSPPSRPATRRRTRRRTWRRCWTSTTSSARCSAVTRSAGTCRCPSRWPSRTWSGRSS